MKTHLQRLSAVALAVALAFVALPAAAADAGQTVNINQATVDMLEQDGADAALVKLLRTALGGREDMDIRWARS